MFCWCSFELSENTAVTLGGGVVWTDVLLVPV